MTATSPAEWLSAGSLGVSAISLIGLALAFADADAAYFDPRPAVARVVYAVRLAVYRVRLAVHAARLAVESGDWDVQLIAVANAKHAVRTAVHPSAEAVRDAVALLILLTTSPKGAMA